VIGRTGARDLRRCGVGVSLHRRVRLGLFPGSEIGAECAAIFDIFHQPGLEHVLSFYSPLRTVAARHH